MSDRRLTARLVERLSSALAPPAGPLLTFDVEGLPVGALDAARAAILAQFPEVFDVGTDSVRFAATLADATSRSAAMARVARALADAGHLSPWRDERYAVGSTPVGEPLFLVERAAARFFGIHTCAAHVNGTTQRNGAVAMWIARRSPRKAIDPGLLDNLVGGGIAAGASVADTVVKEAWEEAGLSAAIARVARPVGTLEIRRGQPDGLQRETIFVHDLELPPDLDPVNQDGEVVGFRLVAPADALRLAGNDAGEDVVTADASLVIADWLMRHGHVAPDDPAFAALERLRHVPPPD